MEFYIQNILTACVTRSFSRKIMFPGLTYMSMHAYI